jgi:hypothetical protein
MKIKCIFLLFCITVISGTTLISTPYQTEFAEPTYNSLLRKLEKVFTFLPKKQRSQYGFENLFNKQQIANELKRPCQDSLNSIKTAITQPDFLLDKQRQQDVITELNKLIECFYKYIKKTQDHPYHNHVATLIKERLKGLLAAIEVEIENKAEHTRSLISLLQIWYESMPPEEQKEIPYPESPQAVDAIISSACGWE